MTDPGECCEREKPVMRAKVALIRERGSNLV